MEATKKPVAKVIGQDGNVFNLVGICAKALRGANLTKEATEMTARVFDSDGYSEALRIMGEYCELK